MKNEKINKSSILVAVFYYNISNITHKTNKNLKIHALVTKQKKENLKNAYWLFNNEL